MFSDDGKIAFREKWGIYLLQPVVENQKSCQIKNVSRNGRYERMKKCLLKQIVEKLIK